MAWRFVKGDIILASTLHEKERLDHKLVKAAGRQGEMYLWPRGEISYTIDPNLPDATRDHDRDAIRRWE
jgi:hypothetical protein